MTKPYQIMDTNTLNSIVKLTKKRHQLKAGITVLSFLTVLFFSAFFLPAAQAGQAMSEENTAISLQEQLNALSQTETIEQSSKLIPYQAEYQVSNGSLNATLKRHLKKSETNKQNQWVVANSASLFMVGVEEHAEFQVNENLITPVNYQYDNQLRAKRNSNLTFDQQSNTVSDPNHFETPLAIYSGLWDKISFQEQLRIDINNPSFTTKTYDIVDTDRIKNYIVEKIGEEIVSTPAGNFNAIKLKQSRADKEEYTLIWLAKDWQNFIIRIDRIEDNKINYQLLFEQGSLNENKITGLSS